VLLAHAHLLTRSGFPVTVVSGAGEAGALPEGCSLAVVPEMNSRHPQIAKISAALEQGQVPPEFDAVTRSLADQLRPILSGFECILIHNILTKHFNLPLTAALFQLMDEGKARGVIAWCHDLSWSSPTSRSKLREGHPWNYLRTPRQDVRYVAVSAQRQKETAETFGLPLNRVRVVYNGVDPDLLLGISPQTAALAARMDLQPAELVLIMPVRITRAKNFEFAFQLMTELIQAGYQARLVITGPPDPHDASSMEYYQQLMELRQRLDLERAVRFVYESGPTDGQPYTIDEHIVAELLRLSDLMLMPSHHEGFGMPVLEAGLAGIPVVASAVPAVLEIALENAFVFSLNADPHILAEQLLDWMEANPQYQLRRRVRRDFTWENIFRRDILPLLQGAP
jgi:glycosyltransferase involved in cell wall biosynthesis